MKYVTPTNRHSHPVAVVTSKLFRAWLVERGAELLDLCQFEILRFRSEAGVSIVYQKVRGSLTFTGQAQAAFDAYQNGGSWRAGSSSGARRFGVEIQTLLGRDGDGCFYCGLPMEAPTVEHLVARTAKGPHHLANLVLAHRVCGDFAGTRSVAEKVRLRDEMRCFIRESAA